MANAWQGKLVRLREIEPDDWQHFYEEDLDTDGARAADFIWFPGSRERHKKWAAERATAEIKNDEMCWAIETPDGAFVGAIDTHACDRRVGCFEYGVSTWAKYRRRGYASDAIRVLLRHFFHELRYQKVTVHVYEFNEPSIRLHRRLGFQEEGRLRRTVYTGGRFYDECLFGLTVEEFDALHGEGQ